MFEWFNDFTFKHVKCFDQTLATATHFYFVFLEDEVK